MLIERFLAEDIGMIKHLKSERDKIIEDHKSLMSTKRDIRAGLKLLKSNKTLFDVASSKLNEIENSISLGNIELKTIRNKLKETMYNRKMHAVLVKHLTFNTRTFLELTGTKIWVRTSKAGNMSCYYKTPKAGYKLFKYDIETKADLIYRAYEQWEKETNETN